jgi:predicted ATPase
MRIEEECVVKKQLPSKVKPYNLNQTQSFIPDIKIIEDEFDKKRLSGSSFRSHSRNKLG